MNRIQIGISLLLVIVPSVLLPVVVTLFGHKLENLKAIEFSVSTLISYVIVMLAGKNVWKAPRSVPVVLYVSFWPLAASFFGVLLANLIYFG